MAILVLATIKTTILTSKGGQIGAEHDGVIRVGHFVPTEKSR